MATDRPDCVGQRDTSRFPLKKVLREAPGERSLLAGGASGGEAPAPSPVRPGRSPAQGGGRGDNPGSCAMKVDLDSPRKCSVLLPEGASPIPGGPGAHSYTLWFVATVSANTPQRALSVPPALRTAAFQLRDRSCANSLRGPSEDLAITLRKAIRSSDGRQACFEEMTPVSCLFFFFPLLLCSGLNHLCILTSQLNTGKKDWAKQINHPVYISFFPLIICN